MENYILSPIRIDTLRDEITEEIARKIEKIPESVIPTPEENDLLARKEAAKYLGISLVTLNEWSKQGTVQAYRISSRIRY